MRASEFIIHNTFIHNIRTWRKKSPRSNSCRWSFKTKRTSRPTKRSSRITTRTSRIIKRPSMPTNWSSRLTKRTSTPSCWGLRNHCCVYLWQLRVDLGNCFPHHQMLHHHSANNRLCQKTKWTNCRIRSELVSRNQHLSNRLPVRSPHYLVLWLLELKEKSWS